MISTLINLLGSFYESKDFAKVESIANRINAAIPGDQVCLKFLGLAYYRTGRIDDAMHIFDQVQGKQVIEAGVLQEKTEVVDSAVVAVSQEATRRVPYLAQAWRDLGNTLLKLRAPQSFPTRCMA